MHIQFQCQNCEKGLRVPEGQQGKTLKCPNCEALVRVPRRKRTEDEDKMSGSGDTKTLRNPASIRHANRNKIRDLSESWEAIAIEMLPEVVVVSFAHGDLRGQVFETRLEKELRALSALVPEQFLIVDFSAIEYVPSRVISTFITIAKLLQENDISLRFYGMSKSITKTMEMVGVGQIVSFFPNRAAALKEIADEHNKKVNTRREKRLGHDKTSIITDVRQKRSLQITILAILAALVFLTLGIVHLMARFGPETALEERYQNQRVRCNHCNRAYTRREFVPMRGNTDYVICPTDQTPVEITRLVPVNAPDEPTSE